MPCEECYHDGCTGTDLGFCPCKGKCHKDEAEELEKLKADLEAANKKRDLWARSCNTESSRRLKAEAALAEAVGLIEDLRESCPDPVFIVSKGYTGCGKCLECKARIFMDSPAAKRGEALREVVEAAREYVASHGAGNGPAPDMLRSMCFTTLQKALAKIDAADKGGQ